MTFQGTVTFDDAQRLAFLKHGQGMGLFTLLLSTQGPGTPESNAYALMGGNGSATSDRHTRISGTRVPITPTTDGILINAVLELTL